MITKSDEFWFDGYISKEDGTFFTKQEARELVDAFFDFLGKRGLMFGGGFGIVDMYEDKSLVSTGYNQMEVITELMGVYDILVLPRTPANGEQVKLWWNELLEVRVGDTVPSVHTPDTYGVVCRAGGVVLVDKGVVTGWVPELPTDRPLFDKWGESWISSEANSGLMGEPYFENEERV